MDEAGVRRVLLVRAFEEERGGRPFLEPAERAAATREARVEAGEDVELFLLRRADRLLPSLREQVPGLDSTVEAAALRGPRAPWVLLLALLVGLAVDRAGGGRFLNLLAFPLVGMIAWNLTVYVALAAASVRRGERGSYSAARGWLLGPAAWIAAPERPWSRWRRVADASGAAAHGQEFLSDWGRAAEPLFTARLRRVLHVGAAGLVLGAVGGMYLRGLALEYRVGWESTFLDAEGVHRFLSLVLAPAAWLGVGEVPDVERLRALRGAPEAGVAGEAATWIHMWAVTALVFVLAPRALLAARETRRVARLERRLPVAWEVDPWALRLLAGERGDSVEVRTLLYAHRLDSRAAEGLTAFVLDLFGNRAKLLDREELAYGDDYLPRPSEREERCELLVFNLAQTPESEVHGELCRAALAQAAGSRGRRAVLVVVDEASLAERLEDDEEGRERLEGRRRTWARVLRELDVEGVFLDLSRHVSNEAMARARAALWPAPLEVA